MNSLSSFSPSFGDVNSSFSGVVAGGSERSCPFSVVFELIAGVADVCVATEEFWSVTYDLGRTTGTALDPFGGVVKMPVALNSAFTSGGANFEFSKPVLKISPLDGSSMVGSIISNCRASARSRHFSGRVLDHYSL